LPGQLVCPCGLYAEASITHRLCLTRARHCDHLPEPFVPPVHLSPHPCTPPNPRRFPGTVSSPRGLLLLAGDTADAAPSGADDSAGATTADDADADAAVDCGQRRLGDLWFLDLDIAAKGSSISTSTSTSPWQQLHSTGPSYTTRSNATAAVADGKLLVLGGWDEANRPLSDLAVLDLKTLEWQQPSTTGTAPSPRGQPTAVATTAAPGSTQQLLVFGGWDGVQRYNDLHALDVQVRFGASGWQFGSWCERDYVAAFDVDYLGTQHSSRQMLIPQTVKKG